MVLMLRIALGVIVCIAGFDVIKTCIIAINDLKRKER